MRRAQTKEYGRTEVTFRGRQDRVSWPGMQ